MAKSKPLTVTLFFDGKPIETLTEEQRETIAKRLSERMSLYYSNHPEEFRKIK